MELANVYKVLPYDVSLQLYKAGIKINTVFSWKKWTEEQIMLFVRSSDDENLLFDVHKSHSFYKKTTIKTYPVLPAPTFLELWRAIPSRLDGIDGEKRLVSYKDDAHIIQFNGVYRSDKVSETETMAAAQFLLELKRDGYIP